MKLSFRNPYYCEVFVKRVRGRFCPVDVAAALRLEQQRQVAEAEQKEREKRQQAAESVKRRREKEAAEMKRQQAEWQAERAKKAQVRAEYRRQHPLQHALRTTAVVGLIASPFLALIGLAIMALHAGPQSPSPQSPDTSRSEAPDTVPPDLPADELGPQDNGLTSGENLSDRGYRLHAAGDYQGAEDAYVRDLASNPYSVSTMNNLAWLRATCPVASYRDGQEALSLARRVYDLALARGELDHQHLGTLAAAYAECGDFENARTYQAMCIRDAPSAKAQVGRDAYWFYLHEKPFRTGIE